MSLKNSNTVALERRMDLASLFCMIGRHGPAVALAVIAMVSVLAAFIIYRTVRGKRRKATAAAADSDSKSPGAERDASVSRVGHALSPEESFSPVESTDVTEGLSDADLIQSNVKLRLRRAAADEKKSPPCSPPKSDIQVPDNKHATSEETEVYKADYQEDEYVTTDKEVSDERNTQGEENLQCGLNNPVYSDQSPHMSENVDDRLQDNECTPETNSVESNLEDPVIHTEDLPASFMCYSKDEKFEEENDHTDSADYINCSNSQICPEDEKNESEDKVTAPFQNSDGEGGLAGEDMEEVLDKDHVNEFTAVQSDTHSPDFGKQEVEITHAVCDLTCSQEDVVLPIVTDQVKEKMLTSDNIACVEECDGSSVVFSPTLPCLSEPIKVDNHDHSLEGITTDAKAQISGIVDFVECQQQQTEVKEDETTPPLDKDTDLNILCSDLLSGKKEMQCEKNETGTIVMLAQESIDPQHEQISQMMNNEAFDSTSVTTAPCGDENIIDPIMDEESRPHMLSCYKDQQSYQMINNEVFEKANVAVALKTDENVTATGITEDSCLNLPSICQDQQSDRVENNEASDEARVDSATDASACDNASITAPIMSEEMSHPDMLSSFQDQQSDQKQNYEDFSKVTTGAVPVMTEDIKPPICKINLSFEQSDLRDNGKDSMSSPGVGEESGISSMAVSPDLQDAGNEFGMTVDNMVLPATDSDLQSEERTEAQSSLFADDVAFSVSNEATAGMVFGPYQSSSQKPKSESTDWAKYQSFAANEDMFGHEIEDSYHSAVDQFMAQIAANVMSFTSELKKKTDGVIEVVEVKESKKGVSAEKKVETKAEKEKEEDYEKTEISIMEATMDNNEWITDSNYQILPWMNVSVPAQDNTKTSQLLTEEQQYSSSLTDASCIDTDTTPSTEVKPTNTLSLVDEITENNKKVVAVQPMHKNVNVTFRIHYLTHSPYQILAVTGNQQELGNWKGFIPLERAKDGHWSTVVSLPAESHVEWKFVLVDKGEVCRWEECGNRLLDTGYGDDLIVHKWWGFL